MDHSFIILDMTKGDYQRKKQDYIKKINKFYRHNAVWIPFNNAYYVSDYSKALFKSYERLGNVLMILCL
jgi:hypothetical protein